MMFGPWMNISTLSNAQLAVDMDIGLKMISKLNGTDIFFLSQYFTLNTAENKFQCLLCFPPVLNT